MPTCENCKRKWTWKQTIKKTTTLNPAMTCPYCEGTQYQTQKSKNKVGIFTLIILSPLLIQIFFTMPMLVFISLPILLAVVVFLFYPSFVELSSEETYLF